MTEPQYIHQLDSFRLIVLRVIESFVHKSLDETISLTKMANVINTHPLLLFLRQQMKECSSVDAMAPVTIRDVILSITKIFNSSQIHIMENNDYFRIKLDRQEFQSLVTRVFQAYKDRMVLKIMEDEKKYKELLGEIEKIEKGELNNMIISQHESQTPIEDEEPPKKKAKMEASPNKKLQVVAQSLLSSVSSYKYASTFESPVNESSAPNYYKLIKEPMDLKAIRQKVKDGRIKTKEELERDILLIFANAVMYNKTGTDIYEWGKEMQVEVDKMIEMFNEE